MPIKRKEKTNCEIFNCENHETTLKINTFVFLGMTNRLMDQVNCLLEASWKSVSFLSQNLCIFSSY